MTDTTPDEVKERFRKAYNEINDEFWIVARILLALEALVYWSIQTNKGWVYFLSLGLWTIGILRLRKLKNDCYWISIENDLEN